MNQYETRLFKKILLTVSSHMTDVYASSNDLPSSVYQDEDPDVSLMPFESLEVDIQTLFSSNCVTPEVVQRFCTTLTGMRDASVVDPISESADLGAVGSFAVASFQRESRFTTSEILLQRLASKQCWTESELSEVIDLLKSRHFRVGDIGLDLTRKVRRSYAISYYFIPFHTISYHFTDQEGAGTHKAYQNTSV